MSTYQFYKRTIEAQSEIRNLCVEEGHFFANRDKLLAQGFEVVGYLIHAPNEEVAKFRFNDEMKNPVGEGSLATPGYDPDKFIFSCFKSIGNLIKKLFN